MNLRHIFTRFQNLNLLILIEDLRRELVTTGVWKGNRLLCPVAHGMPDGATVNRLDHLNQAMNLEAACGFAASVLGTPRETVRRFVELWDSSPYPQWLLGVLEHIWMERVEDAEAAQRVLHPLEAVTPAPLPVMVGPL